MMLLPAEPLFAGAVGKGKGHPAAHECVLGLVSMLCLMPPLSQVLCWPRSGVCQCMDCAQMQRSGKAKTFGLQRKNLLMFIAAIYKNESLRPNGVS